MADGESLKPDTNDRTPGPAPRQIDSGILVAITGPTVTYVTIYRPPAISPPSGFSSGYVYYYIQNALPTSSTTLTTTVSTPSGSPGFSSTQAVKSPHASFTNQNRNPSSSNTLWVDSGHNWAFNWDVTGTGSSASGTVTWWNNSASNLSPSSGSISNNTSVNAGTTYDAVDTLS